MATPTFNIGAFLVPGMDEERRIFGTLDAWLA
jgi:hypothetical protein